MTCTFATCPASQVVFEMIVAGFGAVAVGLVLIALAFVVVRGIIN